MAGNTLPSPEQRNAALSPEALKSEIDSHLEKLRKTALIEPQIGHAADILQSVIPNLTDPESLKNIKDRLGEVIRISQTEPKKVSEMLTKMHEYIQSENFAGLRSPEFKKIVQGTPGMQNMQGAIDKVSNIMESLGKQLSVFGSSTLSMIQKALGPDSFLGRIFGMLMDLPAAQAVHLTNKLKEFNITLASGIDVTQMVTKLRSQVAVVKTKEQSIKKTETYSFMQHCDNIFATMTPGTTLDPTMIENVGSKVINDLEKQWRQDALAGNNNQPQTIPTTETRRRIDVNDNSVLKDAANAQTTVRLEKSNDVRSVVILDATHPKGTKITPKNNTIEWMGIVQATGTTNPGKIEIQLAQSPGLIQVDAAELQRVLADDKKTTLTYGPNQSIEIINQKIS